MQCDLLDKVLTCGILKIADKAILCNMKSTMIEERLLSVPGAMGRHPAQAKGTSAEVPTVRLNNRHWAAAKNAADCHGREALSSVGHKVPGFVAREKVGHGHFRPAGVCVAVFIFNNF